MHRRHAGVGGALERIGVVLVGDDGDDVGVESARRARIEDRLQIAASARCHHHHAGEMTIRRLHTTTLRAP
jgi:hypothetical protein